MLRQVTVNLSLTLRARDKIGARLREAEYPAIAGLLYGRDEETKEEAWRVGYYDRRDIEASDLDAALLVLEGVELVIPQSNFLGRLQDMELDWDGSKYFLTPRNRF